MPGGTAEKDAFSKNGDGVPESEIVERIYEAVMERRLGPGTKLSEAGLCQAFGVGRMRIRRCLLLLASREVIELQSNRGAFVASPTAEQAREVFEARQAIEPTIVRLVAARANSIDLAGLETHTEEERAAQARGERREAIRLSGQFHIRLAEIAGNSVLLRMMKDLVARTSLILGIYGAVGVSTCRDHEHRNLIVRLRARDGDEAAKIMTEHLREIEQTMDLRNPPTPTTDLTRIFARK
jgi:DNA-binding GntR family transcriptional regulator